MRSLLNGRAGVRLGTTGSQVPDPAALLLAPSVQYPRLPAKGYTTSTTDASVSPPPTPTGQGWIRRNWVSLLGVVIVLGGIALVYYYHKLADERRAPQNDSWRARERRMATDVIMPQMGKSIAEATITKWLKKPGDSVKRDEPIFEISTDKVDAEIPSPVAGTLLEIRVPEGQTVAINTVVAVIGDAGEQPQTSPAQACIL